MSIERISHHAVGHPEFAIGRSANGVRSSQPEPLRLNDDPSRLRLRAMAAAAGSQPTKVSTISPEPERNSEQPGAMSEDDQLLEALKRQDADVRRHEEAHRAAAGSLYRGGPHYEYVRGPDGKHYAVAGSVDIDTSPGRTPEETIDKAVRIQRAATAPAEPSTTDRAVAARAAQMEAHARRELQQQQSSENAPAQQDAQRSMEAEAQPTLNQSARNIDMLA